MRIDEVIRSYAGDLDTDLRSSTDAFTTASYLKPAHAVPQVMHAATQLFSVKGRYLRAFLCSATSCRNIYHPHDGMTKTLTVMSEAGAVVGLALFW